ncbi:TniB family NTP-binding protein [Paracoccus fistulariae]|uniref:TniB family NTP-binding protein n=1 Tax=Paracoccus fistulariae TaxID=658446 RepID=A0ABY7SMS2_9RHOB|nr:TniB family NTP-binding protein [Paracoccus fistulariae]MDB6180022.1 TniB family NTP-binding protein [Paracoccus fistulariae]WCR08111.1 TniB family NTP-binding protein [Paracoccus fistulariae]
MIDPARNARIMETLRARHVAAPRDAEFATHLDRLLCRDGAGKLTAEAVRFSNPPETRGILVIDGPGGGKSTTVAHALTRHPALQAGDRGRPAWLGVSVPSPATLKSLGFEILRDSGYPHVSGYRETWSIWDQIRSRLKMLGVCILWIDEAHDLFCKDSGLILRALKSLMQGDEAVIVILSGTERLAEVIRSDPQVQRRFSTMQLRPVSAATDGEDFLDLIMAYAGLAGLRADLSADLVARLFHGARQRFGRSIETLLNAIETALGCGAECLSDDHFAQVWAMQEGCAPGENVFLVADWADITPDLDPGQRPLRRRGRRK